ncbi:MAG: hypothetical protein JNM56_26485 [Planctomycetia bacterium]|nr:hypothetical protein [Planctomycetia bacterium]
MRLGCWLALAVLGVSAVLSADPPAQTGGGVKPAIERGVKALRAMQTEVFALKTHPHGALALWGLTLLECDVPAEDPGVKKAAAELRQASVELTHTYSLALTVMFLDRLGEAQDQYLIQALAVRLLAGQRYADGWNYECPRPTAEEIRRLHAHIRQPREATKTPKGKGPPPLAADFVEQVKLLEKQKAGDDALGKGDNSNTQFAIMGLWAARRQGVPVERALNRVAERFRKQQGNDGGWGYIPGNDSSASMTCAGLLAVAMSHGATYEAALRGEPNKNLIRLSQDPVNGPAVKSALTALGAAVQSSSHQRGQKLRKGHYFLWSLERVALAYNLETIVGKDWYGWGSELLLASQGADGTWRGDYADAYGPVIDTCFSLLFLRRVNLTRDLSATLKGHMADPGEVVLKGGGVGGVGLLAKKLPLGLDFGEKGTDLALPTSLDPEAARLCREVLQAPAEQQADLIQRLKDTKGVVYSDALAAAIPRLSGTAQGKARDALAERLTRMTANTLRGKLTEEDVEVRIAAIQAVVNKEEKQLAGELIPLLSDPTERVARAAHKALKYLANQDFGPGPDATAAERARALAAWKAWWQKQDAGKQ